MNPSSCLCTYEELFSIPISQDRFLRGGGKVVLSAGVAQTVPRILFFDDHEECPQAMYTFLPSAASPLRVPSGRVDCQKPRQVKAVQEVEEGCGGACTLVLALTGGVDLRSRTGGTP